jgi:poly-gamma-glutamate synthesis protein (capsule biosynthesis protein)
MQFCSQIQNIQLLEDIGADIIELTGNHLIDFGYEPLSETIQMYRERGWFIFGGGNNASEARQSITFEHHGNKFAMLGCNVVGPDYDWAGETTPGSAKCDFEWMIAQIHLLKSQGYLVIATLQDYESDAPMPSPSVRGDFLALANAGAIIVSGSQAHSPQGFEFVNNTFIHFGLGNLFFDQMDTLNTRHEFIDRHVFYNGKYVSTQIITTFLEDYARPRLMSKEERVDFLQEYFQFSGW